MTMAQPVMQAAPMTYAVQASEKTKEIKRTDSWKDEPKDPKKKKKKTKVVVQQAAPMTKQAAPMTMQAAPMTMAQPMTSMSYGTTMGSTIGGFGGSRIF